MINTDRKRRDLAGYMKDLPEHALDTIASIIIICDCCGSGFSEPETLYQAW